MTDRPGPEQLYAFRRRHAAHPPRAADALSDAEVSAALLADDGACWTAHDDARLPERFWWALAWRYRDANVYATKPLCQRWLAMARHRAGDALVWAYAVALLPAFLPERGMDYLRDLDQDEAPLLPEALARAVAGGLRRRPELGRPPRGYKHAFGVSDAVSWSLHVPRRGRFVQVFIEALAQHRIEARAMPEHLLLAMKAEARPALEGALVHGDLMVRYRAAELLCRQSAAESAPALEAALRREPGVMMRGKLAEALALCGAASLAPGDFSDDEAGDRALDAALRALPRSKRSPGPAATLRWRGGEALSPGAAAWFIDALDRERLEAHTFALTWIRERLSAADVRALLSQRLEAADARIPEDADDREATRRMFSGSILFTRAVLGGPEQAVAIGEALEVLASGPDGAKGAACIEALARSGAPVAMRKLQALQRGRRKVLGRLAERALERL